MTVNRSKGFTIVELMLAMAFVAFVMLFIVTAIVQTMRIYNKGIAIQDITQSGRQLGEDMTRTMRYAKSVIFKSSNTNANTVQRICANGVTYVWNLETDAGLNEKNKYTGADASNPPIRFIRVNDTTGSLCSNPALGIPKSQSSDLLSSQLTVQRMELTIAENGQIATLNAVISTQGQNKPVVDMSTPSGFSCPEGIDGAFCAFSDFQTTVYIRN